MPKKRRRKGHGNTPRRKRLKRPARFLWARRWLESNGGDNIVRRYARWFGVDRVCAIVELRLLGVGISAEYEQKIKESIEQIACQRRRKKEERLLALKVEDDEWMYQEALHEEEEDELLFFD